MKLVRPATFCASVLALTVVVPLFAQIPFSPAVMYTLPGATSTGNIGDFNGDWIPDLITATRSNRTLAVFPGKGDGTFQSAIAQQMESNADAMAIGDVNGDGKLDAIVVGAIPTNAHMSVYLGQGNGSFNAAVTYATDPYPSAVALGDFNGDGKLDAAVGHGGAGNVRVYPNQGRGTFGTPVVFQVGPAWDLATADMNTDGKLDLILGQTSSPTVILGKGDGTFNPPIYKPIGYAVQSVGIADYNRDGKLDVVSACSAASRADILFGNGDGSLSAPQQLTTPMSTFAARAGDMNQDGKQDVVLTSAGTALTILHGRGDGTFDPYQQITLFGAEALIVADLNHDLRPDIASFEYNSNRLAVLLGMIPTTVTKK